MQCPKFFYRKIYLFSPFRSYEKNIVLHFLAHQQRDVHEKSGNNLLINASPKKIAEIEEIIAVIDVPATQIVLEARLIEVSMGDEEKVGLDWAKLSGVSFKVSEAGAPVDLGTKFSKSLIPGLTFTQNELGLYEESYTEVMKSILPEEMYYQRVWDADQESPIKGILPMDFHHHHLPLLRALPSQGQIND